jgi:hypothetical protein
MFIEISVPNVSSLQKSEMSGSTYSSFRTLRSAGAPNTSWAAKSINIWLLWSQSIVNGTLNTAGRAPLHTSGQSSTGIFSSPVVRSGRSRAISSGVVSTSG